MRAVVATRPGGPEVLEVLEVTEPALMPGAVKVDVVAAGLNPVDAMMRRGEMGGAGPRLLGTEFAGVVREVGAGVTGFAPGDEVIGFGAMGSYAEVVVTAPSQLSRKPAAMSWEVAAGLSGVGQTALTILDQLGLGSGQTLLAHGASGGVGSMLVQLATARGIRVVGTASEANLEYVRSLGGVPVAYGDGLEARIGDAAPGGIDAAIDMSGRWENIEVSLTFVDVDKIASLVPATAQRGVRLVVVQRSSARLDQLVAAVMAGELHAEVQEVFPLAEVRRAHAQLDTRHTRGKLALRVR